MSDKDFRIYNPLTMGATPTNPNPNAQFERDFRLFLRDALKDSQPSENPELLAQMHAQKQEEVRQAKDMGLLGGRGESSRNPGGANNTGIDWLRDGYRPRNNPAEGRDVQGMARDAVTRAKHDQGQRRTQEAEKIAREGHLSKDIGGAMQTNFYGDRSNDAADYGLGNNPRAGMTQLTVPDQYGGGQGQGGGFRNGGVGPQAPPIHGKEQLPTGGYNPYAGVGGSGVPMSAAEAFGTDNQGNGIYGERDRSNPASQNAIMARNFARDRGIDQNVKDFFSQQMTQGIPATVAANNAVMQGLITPEQAKSLEVGAATEMSAPVEKPIQSWNEFTNRRPKGVSPMLNDFGGGLAGVGDAVNEYIANPIAHYVTGQENVFGADPNGLKEWFNNLGSTPDVPRDMPEEMNSEDAYSFKFQEGWLRDWWNSISTK